jgi:hypothetical protein
MLNGLQVTPVRAGLPLLTVIEPPVPVRLTALPLAELAIVPETPRATAPLADELSVTLTTATTPSEIELVLSPLIRQV